MGNTATIMGLSAGNASLSVKAINSCNKVSSAVFTLRINPLPTQPIITGCIQVGGVCSYSLVSMSGVSYTWMVSSGLLLNATNGNSITGTGNAIGVNTISVTSSNAYCKGILVTYNVTVIPNTDVIVVDNQCGEQLFIYNNATTGNLPFNYLTNGLSGNF